MYELVLIIAGLICGIFAIWHKQRKKLIPLLIASFTVGILCLWVDISYNQVTYIATIYLPGTVFPVSIITIAAVYIFMILIIQELILRKVTTNIILKIFIRLLVIAALNFTYSFVDLIIVRTDLCIFHDNNINLFFNLLEIKYLPIYYYRSGYVYFMLGIMLTSILFFVYYKSSQFVYRFLIKNRPAQERLSGKNNI